MKLDSNYEKIVEKRYKFAENSVTMTEKWRTLYKNHEKSNEKLVKICKIPLKRKTLLKTIKNQSENI